MVRVCRNRGWELTQKPDSSPAWSSPWSWGGLWASSHSFAFTPRIPNIGLRKEASIFERALYEFLYRHIHFLAFITSVRRYLSRSTLRLPTIVHDFHLSKKARVMLGFPFPFTHQIRDLRKLSLFSVMMSPSCVSHPRDDVSNNRWFTSFSTLHAPSRVSLLGIKRDRISRGNVHTPILPNSSEDWYL